MNTDPNNTGWYTLAILFGIIAALAELNAMRRAVRASSFAEFRRRGILSFLAAVAAVACLWKAGFLTEFLARRLKSESNSGDSFSLSQVSEPLNTSQSPLASSNIAISPIPWSEVDAIYNVKSRDTDSQKDKAWTRYKDKRVTWKGTVRSVSEPFGSLILHVNMNPDTITSDLLIRLRDSEKSRALKLKKGDSVTFAGTLDAWGSLLPIKLKDGEILN